MMMRYNFSWFTTVLLLLAGIAIFTAADNGVPSNVDCRRFVFAPACRGATIKRSVLPPSQQLNIDQDDTDEILIKFPQQQVMDAEAKPVLMWLDRRPLKFRWAANSRQTQTDAED